MNFQEEYQQKLITAQDAAQLVHDGDWIDYGLGSNIPDLFDAALAQRVGELRDVKIRDCMSLKPYACIDADPQQKSFTYHSWHFGGYARKYHDRGLCYYIPMVFRNQPALYRKFLDVDIACISVTPMNKHGYFNLSLSNSSTRAIFDRAKTIILEVNEHLPWVYGGYDECIHISEVDAIIEGSHASLPELAPGTATEEDQTIAALITSKLRDGSVIQLGIGGMPNTVGQLIAQSDLKDLGMHTEMLCDAFLDMYKAGKLTNKRKIIDHNKGAFTLCLGSQELYDWVDQNPSLASYPVDYINSPQIIAQHDRMVAINSCLEVDLYGQTSAESSGIRHISGSGGQLDFLTGAFMAKEGQSFICMSSTYFDKKEQRRKSRIVPTLSAGSTVTDPRSQAFYLVTEHGIVNLAGKSTWERAEQIISIAHPDFQEELIKNAQEMHIWRKSNKKS